MLTPPSLLDFLSQSLTSNSPPGKHRYHHQIIRSQPQRSHALFPHATNASSAKVYHEEILVILSEFRPVAAAVRDEPKQDAIRTLGQPAAGNLNDQGQVDSVEGKVEKEKARNGDDPAAASTRESFKATPDTSEDPLPSSSTSRAQEAVKSQPIPIIALEATLYTIPSSSTALLYISKVDTTGLAPILSASSPARTPTRALVSAFISYHLLHPPHTCSRVRVHIFAKSQGQYLFPGSVDNATKRVLDDKGLNRWWKGTSERAVKQVEKAKAAVLSTAEAAQDNDLRLFYLVPGLSYLESLPYVPLTPAALSPKTPWSYSHPYSALSSPMHAPAPPSSCPLTDHIPAFPDDPKSRFLHSLTSSTVSPSGTSGDWDDVFLSLSSNTFTTGQAPGARRAAVEADLEKERKRLIDGVPGGVEEWWERMAFRQECCSGQLVGFFTLAAGEPDPAPYSASPATPSILPAAVPTSPSKSDSSRSASSSAHTQSSHHSIRPKPHPLAVPQTKYTKLWSTFHNQDYSLPALPNLATNLERWRMDVERVSRFTYAEEREDKDLTEAEWKNLWAAEGERTIEVEGAAMSGEKRPAEGAVEDKPKVNVLAPRKKKKPTPA
ncbi:hypothetical protein JCM11641_001731 [Rhodosporidiobolus odoratus]